MSLQTSSRFCKFRMDRERHCVCFQLHQSHKTVKQQIYKYIIFIIYIYTYISFPKQKTILPLLYYIHRFHNILHHQNNKCDKTLRGIMIKKFIIYKSVAYLFNLQKTIIIILCKNGKNIS